MRYFPHIVLVMLAESACGAHCSGAPFISDVAVAAIDGREIELHGSGFSTHGSLWVATREFPSTTPGAIWTASVVVMPIPAGMTSGGTVTIATGAGTSNAIPFEVWSLQEIPIPPTPNTNASPLALAVDPQNRFWVNSEFHRDFHSYDPSVGSVAALSPPTAPDPGPFAIYFEQFCLGGVCQNDLDQRTQTSTLGEDVIVDTGGRVWFSQGGASLYEQRVSHLDPTRNVMVWPNHSRIVRFDPPTGAYRVYNIPGDRNEIIGLAWDGKNIWFAQGGRVPGGKIVSFDPERTPYDVTSPTFDFSTSLDYLVNPPDGSGYQEYDVPDATSYPAFPLVDPDGHVWFTSYFGNEVERLDPTTRKVDRFPLPPPRAHSGPGALFATGGPWRLVFNKDRSKILVGEQFDFEIDRLDAARARTGDGACQSLSGGTNPCIESIAVDDPNRFPNGENDLLHSIAFDATGRLWFTQPGPNIPGGTNDHLGYVTPDFAHVVTMTPLRKASDTTPSAPNGIAIDPAGDIWFVEYFGDALAHLHRL